MINNNRFKSVQAGQQDIQKLSTRKAGQQVGKQKINNNRPYHSKIKHKVSAIDFKRLVTDKYSSFISLMAIRECKVIEMTHFYVYKFYSFTNIFFFKGGLSTYIKQTKKLFCPKNGYNISMLLTLTLSAVSNYVL